MATIPNQHEDSDTVRAIYAAYEREAEKESPRGYLGASQIGRPCNRELWYSFRHCGTGRFDGRMLRLFDTGDLEEIRMVKDLRAIGCEVFDVDPDTGEQFSMKALAGHFGGHMDGCACGIPEAPKSWHVLEFKTHNAKSYASLISKGVADAKPEHYAQMQVYMHLTGMRRSLYLARNKDTDHLYSERVRYNADHANALMQRAESIIQANTPPAKLSDDPDHWQCRFCAFHALCHGGGMPAAVPARVNCRNCVHATPEMDTDHGRWSCSRHNKTLSSAEQAKACDDHLFIPDLVTFAQPIDSGTDGDGAWIEYRNDEDGTTWRNGRGESNYSSDELSKLPGPLVGAGTVDTVKQMFGATVESVEVESNG